MSYEERLSKWTTGICPYCLMPGVTVTDSQRGGKHYTCNNKDCRAENHFSKGAEKE